MEKLVLVGRAKKTPKIENFGTSRRPALETLRQPAMRLRGNLHGPRGTPQSDLKATRDETSGQPAQTSRQPAMIGNEQTQIMLVVIGIDNNQV